MNGLEVSVRFFSQSYKFHIIPTLTVNIVNFVFPEAEQVARGNSAQVCVLLQLILGAAVNCDHKDVFIAGLLQLAEIDQARVKIFSRFRVEILA